MPRKFPTMVQQIRAHERAVNRIRKKEGKLPLPPFNFLAALPQAVEKANEILSGRDPHLLSFGIVLADTLQVKAGGHPYILIANVEEAEKWNGEWPCPVYRWLFRVPLPQGCRYVTGTTPKGGVYRSVMRDGELDSRYWAILRYPTTRED